MRLIVLLITSLLLTPSSIGQWYETQGNAFINNGDEKLARTKAIENALKKALLVAGASVSSVQQVVNGLLTQDEINIRATGNVNSFELVSETYQDNLVTVTIRADIFPQEKQCFSADYRKSLLLTKAQLKDREQANIGGIYNIGSSVIKKLANKLTQEGVYLDTKLALKHNSPFSRYKNSMQEENIKTLSIALGDSTDSQYILFAEIQDVSFDDTNNNTWQFWQDKIYNRYFQLSLYIYNSYDGELEFTKEYRNSAPWQHNKRKVVDVNSQTFWQTDYGLMIDNILTQAITDVDENMMCQPTRGKILSVNGNQIRLNLGKRHGVKLGDEFTLLHLNNFTTDTGKIYAGYNVSNFKVKITNLTRDSATAITPEENIIDSIQVNDLAVRY
ncbi:flagella assembly protein FlgT [Thalassotalea profundi]|uniref:Flagella assembly protein FlgT n=1 Tax=Thalassotalea profundi TaxID=2036687 RepID=A0ABQ3IEY8_9GAMM|nr:flagella assembly protein FlgT [Thalassotalea profundi]GHE81151.1 flagella assembly protein FlgT [Thalassotalea profundi]